MDSIHFSDLIKGLHKNNYNDESINQEADSYGFYYTSTSLNAETNFRIYIDQSSQCIRIITRNNYNPKFYFSDKNALYYGIIKDDII